MRRMWLVLEIIVADLPPLVEGIALFNPIKKQLLPSGCLASNARKSLAILNIILHD